jgi:RNA polymerase sigma-70 factor (ECF subfamily)
MKPTDSHNTSSNSAEVRQQAFVRLLGHMDLQLQGYILSLVPNWADALEIAQDVRLTLWEQFDQYDATKDFGVWARTIAHYRVLTFRKDSIRKYAQLSGDFIDVISAEAQRQENSELQESRRSALLQCLESLPQPQKELLVRHYSNGDKLKDIAVQLGETFDGLRQRLLRIRRKLSRCIERRLQAGEDAS